MKKGTCFVGASVIVLFAQLCYANLVVNGGFETDFDNSSTSPVYGSWMAASEAEGVGESDGITPFEGFQMLHFLNPNRLEGSAAMDSMTWQLIDVSPFLGEISNGNVITEMTTRFNRVLGDSQTDTEFRIQIYAFAGSYSSFWPQYWNGDDLAHISESIFTDGDVGTWELATAQLLLPADTEFVAIGLQSIENIFNDTTGIEFDGHYADAVTLTIVPGPATTYYVDALNGDDDNDGLSKETAFATIQKAIDSAYNGDTVIVADGTYTGPGNRDIDFLGKAIIVRSESGPQNCIIDCNGTQEDRHRGFYFHNGEDANSVLDGFTITRGYSRYNGGGIYCRYSSPLITNCTFSGNSVTWRGGGIAFRGSNSKIKNCKIIANYSEDAGGGIHCGFRSSPKIINCTISGNSAMRGGGVSCSHDPTPSFDWNTSPKITNCTITNNSAKQQGGGIYSGGSTSPVISNCIITGNSAEYYGGGMSNWNSNPMVTNCTFSGNSASNGNALDCDSWSQRYPSSVQLTNCILWDGGNEIWNNDNSTITITYSDVQSGWEGEGNIDADPLFVSPGYRGANGDWVEGDYYLLPDSLCIDAGDPNYIPEPNETDLDGNPRVIGDQIDMGAYESNYIQAAMKLTPQTLNCNSKGNWVKAHLTLPEGFLPEDVDVNEPAIAEPMGAESEYIKVLGAGTGPVRLEICFDREAFCETITETGEVEITVIGSLTTSRYFYATDTIKIKPRR